MAIIREMSLQKWRNLIGYASHDVMPCHCGNWILGKESEREREQWWKGLEASHWSVSPRVMMSHDASWWQVGGRERGIHFNNCLNMKVASKAISQQLVIMTHSLIYVHTHMIGLNIIIFIVPLMIFMALITIFMRLSCLPTHSLYAYSGVLKILFLIYHCLPELLLLFIMKTITWQSLMSPWQRRGIHSAYHNEKSFFINQ